MRLFWWVGRARVDGGWAFLYMLTNGLCLDVLLLPLAPPRPEEGCLFLNMLKTHHVFKVMEQKRKEFINEWALQQTSLESVFLRIAKAAVSLC